MKRKVNYLFIAIILFISLITNVKANTIDLSKKGSIRVTLKEKSENVLIDGADGLTSQIDLLMIGAKGIYVVEVKMYANARIYGDGKKTLR